MFKPFVYFLALGIGSGQACAETFPRYLLEAEALCSDHDSITYSGKGYGMGRPEMETGGMVVLQATEMEKGAFVLRKKPFPLTVPAGVIPPGKYKLSLRAVRWVGAKELPAISTLRVTAGKTSYDYVFPATAGALTPPGGVYVGEAQWQWIEIPTPVEVDAQPLTLDLSMIGGSGNYFGLLVDAVELTPVETANTAPAAAEARWSGDVAGAFLADLLPDVTHSSLIAGDPKSANPVNAKTTIAPPVRKDDDFLCGWIRNELPLKAVGVRLSDGSAESEEIPLGQLLHAEPIRVGYWYLLCLPSDDPRLKALDRKRPWVARLSATPLTEGVRLQTSDWRWTSRKDLTRWSNEKKALSPDVREELAVASGLLDLKSEAVASDKKLILWPAYWMAPDTHFLRDHIASIKLAGVNGTIFSYDIIRDGKTASIGGEIFSTTPLSWNDFAPGVEDLGHIDWSGLKESLFRVDVVQGGNVQLGIGIDWFDEAAWKTTLQNTGFCARFVRMAKARGFMLDTEEYPPCAIFQYPAQKLAAVKSFADYARQAFLRGQQFAEVCQKECPGMTIVLTHGTTELLGLTQPPYSSTNTHGNLLPAFVDGMLSVAGPEIVDGHESSYTYHSPREFLEGDWQMDEAAAFSRDPALYRQKMGKGFGVWIDPWKHWNSTDENKNYFSPSDLENTLHWALRKGRYVWLYTESINWFREMTFPNEHQPSTAYDQALKASRSPHDPRWLPASSNLNP